MRGERIQAVDGSRERRTVWEALHWFPVRRLFWIALIAGILSISQYQFWQQPVVGDRGNWDYFAQVIARGGVPYRDVVNIKSPLSAYIGAAAILAGRPFGIRDIFAIRIVYIFLAGLCVAFTFLLALDFSGLRTAVLAAAAMLMFDVFARQNSGGVQPKTPMILFGLLSLSALFKDRPFASGLFGMLSALSWQPGLLFTGVAALAASRYLTSWRDRRALKVIAGAALPLAVMLAYFWMAGALKDFYLWNFDYTTTVYAPRESRTVGNFFAHLVDIINKPYRHASWLFYLSIAGVIIALWRQVQRKRERKDRLDDAPRDAVIIAGLVYFAFCMLDIQGPVDLIPLLPFVAIFAAVAMDFTICKLVQLTVRARKRTRPVALKLWATGLLVAAMLFRSALNATDFDHPFPLLKDQEAVVAEIVAQLQPGNEVFTLGVPELLVLGGLTNSSKYFLLDRAKDSYLDVVEPGGFQGWLERLKARRPKIIALSRFTGMEHEKDFQAWAAADYVPRANRAFAYYVRK